MDTAAGRAVLRPDGGFCTGHGLCACTGSVSVRGGRVARRTGGRFLFGSGALRGSCCRAVPDMAAIFIGPDAAAAPFRGTDAIRTGCCGGILRRDGVPAPAGIGSTGGSGAFDRSRQPFRFFLGRNGGLIHQARMSSGGGGSLAACTAGRRPFRMAGSFGRAIAFCVRARAGRAGRNGSLA